MTKNLQSKSTISGTSVRTTPTSVVIGSLMTIIINTALLIWVLRLSDKNCGCIGGWRQELIKYFAGFTIFVGVLRLVNSQGDFKDIGSNMPKVILGVLGMLGLVYLVASIVNIYAVITYVDDINETKCACAINDMTRLNKTMIVLRWFYIVGLCLFGAMLLFSFVTYIRTRSIK